MKKSNKRKMIVSLFAAAILVFSTLTVAAMGAGEENIIILEDDNPDVHHNVEINLEWYESDLSEDSPRIAEDLRGSEDTEEVIVRMTELRDMPSVDRVNQPGLEHHAEATQEAFLEWAERERHVEVENEYWIINGVRATVDFSEVSFEELTTPEHVEGVVEPLEPEVPEPIETNDVEPAQNGDYTYGLEQVNAPQAWDVLDNHGEGVSVAVLDSGANDDHDDIHVDRWLDTTGEFDEPADPPGPAGGHGTHVAGTIIGGDASGTHIGVAPEADHYHARIFDEDGDVGDIEEGWQWAIDQDSDIMSNSWGASGVYDEEDIDMVQNAMDSGTLPIISSGNDGVETTGGPANVYDGVSVGMTNEEQLVNPSSTGEMISTSDDWDDADGTEDWPDEYPNPDVVAPGTDVVSADTEDTPDGTTQMTGTSMAAPHVSGVAALYVSHEGGYEDPYDLKDDLMDNTWTPDDHPSPEIRYGQGIVDARMTTDNLLIDDADMPDQALPGDQIEIEVTLDNTEGLDAYQDLKYRFDIETVSIGIVDDDGGYGESLEKGLLDMHSWYHDFEIIEADDPSVGDHEVYVVQDIDEGNVEDFVDTTEDPEIGVVYLDQHGDPGNAIDNYAQVSDDVDGTSEGTQAGDFNVYGEWNEDEENHPLLEDWIDAIAAIIHTGDDGGFFPGDPYYSSIDLAAGSEYTELAEGGVWDGDFTSYGTGMADNEDTNTVLLGSAGHSADVTHGEGLIGNHYAFIYDAIRYTSGRIEDVEEQGVSVDANGDDTFTINYEIPEEAEEGEEFVHGVFTENDYVTDTIILDTDDDGPSTPSDPEPEDGATDVSTDAELSALVEHDEGESMDVSFFDGSDDLIGTDNNVADGDRAEVEWDDLDYGTTYDWYAVSEDDEGETAESSLWSFTTLDAPGPVAPTDPEPEDGETGVPTDVEISAYVEHEEGESMDVSFYDGADELIGTDNDVEDEERAEVEWTGLDHETEYEWYAVSEDDDGNTAESSLWSFTTQEPGPLPPSEPEPEDGATDVSTDPDLSVLVEHEEEADEEESASIQDTEITEEDDYVDPTNWPDGSGSDGDEHITDMNIDDQVVVEGSGTDAYYDHTDEGVAYVEPGGTLEVEMSIDDAGFEQDYGIAYVDWAQNQDWTEHEEYEIFANEESGTYSTIIDVPEDAESGSTLLRTRLSWDGWDDPDAEGELGEVQDFSIHVEEEDLTMDVTFFDASDDSVIGTVEDVEHGERAEHAWEDLEQGTSYDWYAESDDGEEVATSDTWTFTTEHEEEVDYIEIDTDTEVIVEGEQADYTATAYNEDDEEIGDVTAETEWSIDEDAGGEWDQENGIYSSENPGEWTVTGEYEGETDESTLTVEPEDTEVSYVVIYPEDDFTTEAGEEELFDAEAYDENDELITDDPTEFEWQNAEDGVFYETETGDYDVTATYDGVVSDPTTVTVEPAEAEEIEISPQTAEIEAGGSQVYTATATDEWGNEFDVTGETDWSDDIDDSEWLDNEVTAYSAGDWTVTGEYEGLDDTATLVVEPGPVETVTIWPQDEETVDAGEQLLFDAEAEDEHGNLITDDVDDFDWQNAMNGIFEETETGEYDVTATYNGETSPITTVIVGPAEVDYVEIHPEEDQEILAGEELEFTASAYDEYDNLITEDVTEFTWQNIDDFDEEENVAIFTEEESGEYDVTATYEDQAEATSPATTVFVEEETYDVTFEVYDEENEAYEGAEIVLTNYEDLVTDENGEAVLEDVEQGSDVDYLIDEEGYDSVDELIEDVTEEVTEEVYLEVSTYDVTFEVLDEDDQPYEGAEIILTDYENLVTDENGEAVLDDVEYGSDVDYLVDEEGYDPVDELVEDVTEDVTETVYLEEEPELVPPTGLEVEKHEDTENVEVLWDDVGAPEYNVYHSTDQYADFDTWTELETVEDGFSYIHEDALGGENYYIVRSADGEEESEPSTMGFTVEREFEDDADYSLHYVSIPTRFNNMEEVSASDIVEDIEGDLDTADNIYRVVKWDYTIMTWDEDYTHSPLVGWPDVDGDDNFEIEPGDGIGIYVQDDAGFSWHIAGVDTDFSRNFDDDADYSLHYVSVPYTLQDYTESGELRASDIVHAIEGDLDTADNIYRVVKWDYTIMTWDEDYTHSPLVGWPDVDGDDNFEIEPGDGIGIYVQDEADFTWEMELITPYRGEGEGGDSEGENLQEKEEFELSMQSFSDDKIDPDAQQIQASGEVQTIKTPSIKSFIYSY